MAKKTFENALQILEDITRELEEGNLSLEESLKKFNEGVKLADFCNKKLEESQKKVDLLLKKNGSLTSVPFESKANNTEG
ncbi:MAG: exodeoxyribonuclease VII small subunit [Thermodesulfobacteriota bacterium]|nr:exodeoxyribonuclease VII small subunit [Thermodesulfobacteriota bacterium]